MPGSDGIEAARRIRAAEADRGARRTPIIALTANALDEEREACLRRRHGRVSDQAARPRAAGECAGDGVGARVAGGVTATVS